MAKETDMSGLSKDPVCGMPVDSSKAQNQTEFNGKNYYFCSEKCKTQFKKDPQGYSRKVA